MLKNGFSLKPDISCYFEYA